MASEAVTPTNESSLDQILGNEDQEIAALLKKAGVEDTDLLSTDGEAENRPEPKETSRDLHAETPEPVEPVKEPEEPEPQKEPEEVKAAPEPEPVKEEAKPPEPKRERVPTWKLLRDADRRAKALEEENRALKQRFEQPPMQQPDEAIQQLESEDPIQKIENRLAQQDAEIKAQAEINRQNMLRQQIVQEEVEFKKAHPDYDDAVRFVAQKARGRFAATGELDDMAQKIITEHRDEIEKHLARQGVVSPDDEQFYQTAENLAFAVVFEQERQKFVQRQLQRGRNVAQAAFELAESEGYTAPETAAAPVAPVPPAPSKEDKPSEAQQRVQRQANLARANQSLSAMQNSGPPKSLTVKSKTEFMRMTPEAQDKLVEMMEEVDPDWVQKLPD